MSPYVEYYLNQAGSGFSTFEGVKYQKGGSFFGRLLSGAILPALRYLGKKALGTGIEIGTDVLMGKKDFKSAAKDRGKRAVKNIAENALDRAKLYVQTGKGFKRNICKCSATLPLAKRRKSIKRRRKKKKSKKVIRKVFKKRVIKRRRKGKKKSRITSEFDFLK